MTARGREYAKFSQVRAFAPNSTFSGAGERNAPRANVWSTVDAREGHGPADLLMSLLRLDSMDQFVGIAPADCRKPQASRQAPGCPSSVWTRGRNMKTHLGESTTPPSGPAATPGDPLAVAETRSDAAPLEVSVILPRQGWQPVDYRELWRYRELLYFLVWRDIKVRYKQTVLGAAWAILQPVLSMIIFSIVFGRFAGIPSDGVPYPIFVFAALLPWTFFQNAVSISGTSLVLQANLLTKIYFPRVFVPVSGILASLVDLALGFCVYFAIMLWYMQFPGFSVMLLPALLLLTVMTATGAGCLLSALTVSYHDFRYVVPFMLQAWMYASPVVYPVTMFPEKYHWILAINPMVGIIGAFRSTLLNQPIDWLSLGVSTFTAFALFVFGLLYFRRTERRFADIV